MSRSTQSSSRWLILAAILVGFGLRTYHLGADSLWNDEAGQALAALQPNLTETLAHIRSHAGSMPLDYLATRLATMISTSEFLVRMPSVFWSTVALAILVALAREVSDGQIATIAVCIAAVNPQLIYYAQEARPYAALLAFSLLSTFLLLRAFDVRSPARWLLWVTMTAIGAYFHLYVLWTVLFGVAFVALSMLNRHRSAAQLSGATLLGFATSVALVGLLVAPGYLYFVGGDDVRYTLFEFGGNVWSVTAAGFGWQMERYPILSIVLITLTVAGAIVAIVRRHTEIELMALLFGLPLIVAAIFLVDLWQGYWYLPRQLLHLQPILAIFTAIGCHFVAAMIAGLVAQGSADSAPAISVATALIVVVTAIASVPRILDGYAFAKGNGRPLVEMLTERSDAATIYVHPGHEVKVYLYYAMAGLPATESLLAALKPVDWDDILAVDAPIGRTYVLAPPTEISVHKEQLLAAGYRPILEPVVDGGYQRSLWGMP